MAVRVLGDLQRLPQDLRKSMAEAVKASREQQGAVLNVCFAYSAAQELERSIEQIHEGIRSGILHKM